MREQFKCPRCDGALPELYIVTAIMKLGNVKKFEMDEKGKVTYEFHNIR